MRGLAWAIAATVLAGAASPALGQNIYISQLYNQVLENADIMGAGYALDAFGVQRMLPGDSFRIPVAVPANVNLTVMGDCDEDCVDMDVAVYDQGGAMLDDDILPDNFPVVSITSGSSTYLEVEMTMVDCQAAYCYAAYSIFVAN